MEKIPTMFERDWEGDRSRVLDKIVPSCEWVFAGEGTPTRKYDGTCVMFDGTSWWARRQVKPGESAPANFVETGYDEETEKTFGWEPVEQSPFMKSHGQALESHGSAPWQEGTYELCGPKVQKNPEGFVEHRLIRHALAEPLPDAPRSYEELSSYLADAGIEGIVWHHPDGRLAKIKARDFGIRRG